MSQCNSNCKLHTWIAAEDDNEYFDKKKQCLPQTGKRAPTSLVEEQKRTPSSSLSPSFSPSGPLVAPLLQRLPSSMSADHCFHRYQRSPSLLSRDAAFIAIGHKLVPEPFDLDGARGI